MIPERENKRNERSMRNSTRLTETHFLDELLEGGRVLETRGPSPVCGTSSPRLFVRDAAFQGCPCPMQSCPKNVDTGALIGNGKGAPVISGTGPSLPPSALVGPPSPARGLAGLAPPHGANAWDTERVQLNASHRNLNQNQPTSVPPSHNLVGGPHNRPQSQDCRSSSKVCIARLSHHKSHTTVHTPVS